jgi:hypothetical protein
LTLVENVLIMKAGEYSEDNPEPDGKEHQRRLFTCKAEAAIYHWYGFSEEVNECPPDCAHDGNDKNDGIGKEQSDGSAEGKNDESLKIGSMVGILDAKMRLSCDLLQLDKPL